MSRKNRNARRQANKPLNAYQLSMPIPQPVSHPTTLRMLDDHCGFEFATLSSTMLETDTSYQRRIDDKRVERIVENFDSRLVNPVKVSFRDGHYYVFDGAHTLAALKQVHKFDNFMVDCMLFQGLNYEDEAYLFALQRGESKEVAMAARLKALLKSNDESAADLRRRTEEAGFQLMTSRSSAKGRISCIGKLWKIYNNSPELYSDTLSILREAWRGEPWSLTANIIGGVAMFVQVYAGEMNRGRLLKQLSGVDLATLNRLKDDNSKNKDYTYAFAIFKLYNKIGGKGALMPYGLYDFKS